LTTSAPAFAFNTPASSAPSTLATATKAFGASDPKGPASLTSTATAAAPSSSAQSLFAPISVKQREPATKHDAILWDGIMSLKDSLDPSSSQCKFTHYFYNDIDPANIHRVSRPLDQSEILWNNAQADNPDPSKLIPALAKSFSDILKRAKIQSQTAKTQADTIQSLLQGLSDLRHRQQVDHQDRLLLIRRRHSELATRILKVHSKLFLLQKSTNNVSVKESALNSRLDQLYNHQFQPRKQISIINDLWIKLQQIREQQPNQYSNSNNHTLTHFNSLDSNQLNLIKNILDDHQTTLTHLMETVKQDKEIISHLKH
jgi:nuclear pore complex protein Nup54